MKSAIHDALDYAFGTLRTATLPGFKSTFQGAGAKRAAARIAEKRKANEAIPDNVIPTRQILRFAGRKGTLKQRLARGN